jgi:hypothetical protein
MQTSQGYIFCILQHFATKFCNFTDFDKFFTGIYFFTKISLTCKLSIRTLWLCMITRYNVTLFFHSGYCQLTNICCMTVLGETTYNTALIHSNYCKIFLVCANLLLHLKAYRSKYIIWLLNLLLTQYIC